MIVVGAVRNTAPKKAKEKPAKAEKPDKKPEEKPEVTE